MTDPKGLPPTAISQDSIQLSDGDGIKKITRVATFSEDTETASSSIIRRVVESAEDSDPIAESVRSVTEKSTWAMHQVHEVQKQVETYYQFLFLRADSQPVVGLQDWSTSQWAKQLNSHMDQANELVKHILGPEYKTGTHGSRSNALARAIKEKLHDPLPASVWKEVIEFQNVCLNVHHSEEQEALTYYMNDGVLAFSVFRRDFPLGVDERVMENK